MRFVEADHGELSLTDMVKALRTHGEAVNRGDLSAAERMLNSKAVALNAIFGELARRAALNTGTCLGATQSYLRLAFKSQSQSRGDYQGRNDHMTLGRSPLFGKPIGRLKWQQTTNASSSFARPTLHPARATSRRHAWQAWPRTGGLSAYSRCHSGW
jgi:hypothetical protein